MPVNFKKSLLAAAGVTDRSIFDFALLQRFSQAIEGRIAPLEDQRADADAAIAAIRKVGLDRINEILGPAIASVQQIQERGFLIATSATPAEIALGNVLTLFVEDEDERAVFTPSPFTALTRVATPDDYAIARTISYDRENGSYTCEVVAAAGDPGPHADWVIAGVAGSTIAQYQALEDMRDVLAQAEVIEADIAAAQAARDEALQFRNEAEQFALEAGGGFDSSVFALADHGHQISDVHGLVTALSGKASSSHGHIMSEVDGLNTALGNTQATSEKGQANGYAPLDANSFIPAIHVPRATVADHRALSGGGLLVADRMREAAELVGLGSGGSLTPHWPGFISGTYSVLVSGSTVTIANPTGVIPGTVRVIWLLRSFTGVRSVVWGSDYTGPDGEPPEVDVDSDRHWKLVLEATPGGKILVAAMEYAP